MKTSSLFKEPSSDKNSVYEKLRISKHPTAKKSREITNQLWKKYKDYADKNFKQEIKNDFHARFWEMYLACILLQNGFFLQKHKGGPDILFKYNNQKIWVEATAPSPGESEDRVPEIEYNSFVAQKHPEENIILRYRSAIEEKYNKFLDYKNNKLISENDSYSIAINSSKIGLHRYGEAMPNTMPEIFKAVLPIGHFQVFINKNNLKIEESNFAFREKITKKSGAAVETDIFLNPHYKGLSRILFSHTSVWDYQNLEGEDLLFIHNPYAINPVDKGFFKVGKEFIVKDSEDEINITRIK